MTTRHHPTNAVRTLALVTLAVLLAACSFLPGASLSPRDLALRDLAVHQAQWQSKGPASYSFTITRQCFCPSDPLDVVVVDGVATKVTVAGKAPTEFQVTGVPLTIQALFALVAAQDEAADMTVEWDAGFGYPTSVQVDPIENAIDDEFGYTITNFKPAS